MMDEKIKHNVIYLVNKLCIENRSRIPYTNHHDYLVTKLPYFKNMSRAEIGRARENAPDFELYSLSFVYTLEHLSPFYLLKLSSEDFEMVKEILMVAKIAIDMLTSQIIAE